ncbi:hypothetical protein KIW84_020255 [Lathyrus oleraceus]|uniref:ATP-dependent Clp protease proteolytic subunit n=1 Tax=Pisum sativum TaxID=3888 RepID=A0A9D4Y4V4_PEA|nr:hypothetical protein KIW84_020255 [Pisum sativum]
MAVSPYAAVSTPRVCSPPRSKSPSSIPSCSFGASSVSSSVNAQFFGKVNKVLSFWYANQKPVRAQFLMMPIGTPRVRYKTPELVHYLMQYRERVVFIAQEINEEFSNQILATLLYLDSIDNTRFLYLYINGPGGELTPCLALYDTMQSLETPIATHCVGQAYNMASFLLAAGQKVLYYPTVF